MPVTRDDILQVIDGSLLAPVDYPEDVMRWLDIEGVSVHYAPGLSSAFLNMAGVARLDETNADAAIEKIKAHFDAKGHVVGWFWGELSTPADLRERLEAAGFIKIFTLAGMVLEDLNHNIAVNPAVTVRQAGEADYERIRRLYCDAYPMDEDTARGMIGMFDGLNGRHYLAYIDGQEDPVSVASMFYYPGKAIMSLQGAATLPEFRGNGIYTALVARRLDDARADGIEAAILQADVNTSAPVCAKLGFETILDMALYMYPAPQGEH